MKRTLLLGTMILVLAVALEPPARAQNRVAVVNTREVLTKCNLGAQAVAQIQVKYDKRRRELAELEADVQRLHQEAQAPQAKPQAKARYEEQLARLRRESQNLQQEIAREESEKFKPVLERLNAVLSEYAREHKLDGIQDRSQYLYLAPSMDITEEIIGRVNKAP